MSMSAQPIGLFSSNVFVAKIVILCIDSGYRNFCGSVYHVMNQGH